MGVRDSWRSNVNTGVSGIAREGKKVEIRLAQGIMACA